MALKDFPVFESNPAQVDNIIRVRRDFDRVGSRLLLIDSKTNEVLSTVQVENKGGAEYQKFDNEKFVKIYKQSIEAMSRLHPTSLKVLFYIFNQIEAYTEKRKTDHFSIHLEECMEFCGFATKKSVYNGIDGLLKIRVMFRKTGGLEFWVNPNAFFNGSRVQYMEDKIAEKQANEF
jgi:hypothetical protein